ncbi:MAG: hypothetical protein HOP15_06870 [Planctomycetes bacterium]|nr:hypothetical protein [Planctomycetota bacterium]
MSVQGALDVAALAARHLERLRIPYDQKGGEVSDRQWRDVLGVLKARGSALERSYLEEWAPRLGVFDLLRRAEREAGLTR